MKHEHLGTGRLPDLRMCIVCHLMIVSYLLLLDRSVTLNGIAGLDNEYRYWAFMETHPAHVPLPVNSYSEAWDKLTWSYTGEHRFGFRSDYVS